MPINRNLLWSNVKHVPSNKQNSFWQLSEFTKCEIIGICQLLQGPTFCDRMHSDSGQLKCWMNNSMPVCERCEQLKSHLISNINCSDMFGNTALHLAAMNGRKQIVIILLQSGIDATLHNARSMTRAVFGRPYYRSSLWYSVSSVVCDVLYCGKTVRPSQKVSEGVNRKPGSKNWLFGSPPYFYFRFRRYGHWDGRFCLIFAHIAQQSILGGTNGLSSSKPCAYCLILLSELKPGVVLALDVGLCSVKPTSEMLH